MTPDVREFSDALAERLGGRAQARIDGSEGRVQ